jgi:hypothetical protein
MRLSEGHDGAMIKMERSGDRIVVRYDRLDERPVAIALIHGYGAELSIDLPPTESHNAPCVCQIASGYLGAVVR